MTASFRKQNVRAIIRQESDAVLLVVLVSDPEHCYDVSLTSANNHKHAGNPDFAVLVPFAPGGCYFNYYY
jgi:hypothetical protein